MEVMRKAVASARQEVPELLAEAGVTKESFDARREVELEAAGRAGIAGSRLDGLVLSARRDAGFGGRPGFEPLRRVDRAAVGTIYLSRMVAVAPIASANPGRASAERPDQALREAPAAATAARHSLDELSLSFHPRGDPPTNARVDGAGPVEMRTVERATKRR